jgi:glycine/D-amino acid oxidase-like deaminating enzyme
MTHDVALVCDLLVIGSGAAGLSTAVTAASLGLDVIVVEKEPQLGGTTAWSGGWLWIPRNPLAMAARIHEDPETPALICDTNSVTATTKHAWRCSSNRGRA